MKNMTPCLLINEIKNQAIPVAKWLLEENNTCWEGIKYVYDRTQEAAPIFEVYGKQVNGTKTMCEFWYAEKQA